MDSARFFKKKNNNNNNKIKYRPSILASTQKFINFSLYTIESKESKHTDPMSSSFICQNSIQIL